MTVSRFLLTDVAAGHSQRDFQLRSAPELTLAGAPKWSVETETLRGGVSEGVEVVTIDNGVLVLRVLPTRGMNVWNATKGSVPIGWQSPVAQPVHPAHGPLESAGGLGWLRGFNELVARCGLASNGPPGPDPVGNPLESPLTLHGRIANLPAHRLVLEIDDDGPGTIRLTGEIDEVSLFGTNLRLTSTLSTRAGSNEFTISDVVTNRGATPAESQLLYHINVGPPVLEAGSRLAAAAREVAPRDSRAAEGIGEWDTCGAPSAGFAEQVYFLEPLVDETGESFALLRNAGGDRGISVHFDPSELPCLSFWKNTGALEEGYVAGIEPATNYPNHRSFERTQGRVMRLEAGESRAMRVRVAVHDRLENVALLEALADQLAGESECTRHESTRSGWSPE